MFAIAPTDLDWFEQMRSGPVGRVVNFWTPTPWGVRGLHPGDRLYFMLKAPIRKIGGYGTFTRYVDMPASAAWQTYGLGNGVDSQKELVTKVQMFAQKRSKDFTVSDDPLIGCIELSDPVLLDDDRFVTPEECGHDFPIQVVKLKYFPSEDSIAQRLELTHETSRPFVMITGVAARRASLRKDRKEQPLFRQSILKNYRYMCCMCDEGIVELLEAAHLQPYINEQSNHPQNGLCLRVDLHRLFDEGFITIAEDHTIVVSSRLDGTSYSSLSGKKMRLPSNSKCHPSEDATRFHRTEVFRK